MIQSHENPQEIVVGKSSSVINYGIKSETNEDGEVAYNYFSKEVPSTNMGVLQGMRVKLEKEAAKGSYSSTVESMMTSYPQYERDTFDCQEREAKEWTADNTVNTPLIDAIAATRGIAKDELVSKILAKADAFKVAIGSVIGDKQKVLG